MKQEYHSNLIDLEEAAYGFYRVIGEDHTQLLDWKKEAEERAKIHQARMNNDVSVNPAIKQEKVGRNDPCSCGSGKKYKKCCGAK